MDRIDDAHNIMVTIYQQKVNVASVQLELAKRLMPKLKGPFIFFKPYLDTVLSSGRDFSLEWVPENYREEIVLHDLTNKISDKHLDTFLSLTHEGLQERIQLLNDVPSVIASKEITRYVTCKISILVNAISSSLS